MKKSNRIKRGIGRCLGSTMCVLTVLFSMIGGKWDAVSAAGPEQTTEEPSLELRHVHTGQEGACYENGTICCGLEEGEVLGTFRIRKTATEEGYALQALLESDNDLISSYAIRWDASGAKESRGVSTLPIKENRTYTATISWRDRITNTHHEGSLSYTDLASVILLRFFDGSTILQEEEIPYGGEWPEVSVPEREGYDFRGFYRNNALYYDAYGDPVGFDTEFEETTLHLYAGWQARSYRLWYGDDEDGDGRPDGSTVVYYDEELPQLTIPESEPGYHFDGYWYNGRQLLDGNGHSKQVWQWDTDEEIFLESRWAPNIYIVYYGADADEDGVPDRSFEVRYGEAYEAVEVPELPEGKQFEGYKLGGEVVFDKKGKPADVWHWTEEKPVLQMVISEVPVETPAPTPESEEAEDEEDRPEEDGAENTEDETDENEEKDTKPAVVPEEPAKAEPVTETEEAEEEPEYEEVTEPEPEDTEEAEIPQPANRPETEKEPELQEITEEQETEKEPELQEITEEQETEELQETEEMPETEEIREVEEIWEVEEETESDGPADPEEPEEPSEDTGRTDNGEGAQSETKQGAETDPEPTVLPEAAEFPGDAEKTEPAEAEAAEVLPEMYANRERETETDVAEAAGQNVIREWRRMKRREAVKKAAVVAAVTTGCLGGVAGIYAGLVYLLAMAEVDTICIDGRKKRLGRRNIRSEKGRSFSIVLGRDIIERCETDRICIRMSSVFVRFHKNRCLVVKAREKSLTGYINREVYLTLPSL